MRATRILACARRVHITLRSRLGLGSVTKFNCFSGAVGQCTRYVRPPPVALFTFYFDFQLRHSQNRSAKGVYAFNDRACSQRISNAIRTAPGFRLRVFCLRFGIWMSHRTQYLCCSLPDWRWWSYASTHARTQRTEYMLSQPFSCRYQLDQFVSAY